MSLNSTPSSERIHIGFFGRRNAGKSSVVNAFTNQELSVVSDTPGTTTDPVYKSMELLPMGPVTIIDTPGFDDTGFLGEMRVKKTKQALNKTDVAVLIVDSITEKTDTDLELISLFEQKNISYIIAYNKSDLLNKRKDINQNEIYISAKTRENINELKEKIACLLKPQNPPRKLISDLIKPNDFVVLVVPIDDSAPKGRLILPQQQVIRDILEAGAIAVVTKDTELEKTLSEIGKKPTLVVTDSQVFKTVNLITPKDIRLTSFSVLFARYKGNLKKQYQNATTLEKLKDGDTILISEGCTHHRQCNDIGSVKLPAWINEYTGKKLNFEYSSGTEFPTDLKKYKMVVHCGGCMLNEREMNHRIEYASSHNVPITNYGVLIAYINGILQRCTEIFGI